MQPHAVPSAGDGIEIVARHDGTIVVRISGELDLSTVPRIRARVAAAAETAGNVRLDVQDVRFCDASGLAVFTSAAERVRRRGGTFRLVNVPPQLRRVISLAELAHLLD